MALTNFGKISLITIVLLFLSGTLLMTDENSKRYEIRPCYDNTGAEMLDHSCLAQSISTTNIIGGILFGLGIISLLLFYIIFIISNKKYF